MTAPLLVTFLQIQIAVKAEDIYRARPERSVFAARFKSFLELKSGRCRPKSRPLLLTVRNGISILTAFRTPFELSGEDVELLSSVEKIDALARMAVEAILKDNTLEKGFRYMLTSLCRQALYHMV